ncbi:restriction endonuclease subunit S [Nocardia barduliensis]|uniref:restriction endonuclease subunit S n=1 Tax=Nocardia barduliensis TaxID=2736643 RepID=UPI0015718D36|nr:restriction endonuclease subunit S [Nocardia barduliensis]
MSSRIPLWTVLRSREEFGDSELPLLTVKSESGIELRDLSQGRQPSEDLSRYSIVRAGDLVVNRLWARFGAYGTSRFDGVISPAYWVLSVDGRKIDPRYLHFLLRSEPFRQEIGRRSKNMPPNGFEIPWDQFKKIEIPSPPLEEQRRIADFLDGETSRIDSIAQRRRRMLKLLSERQSAFRDGLINSLADSVGELPLRRFITRIEQGASPQCHSVPRKTSSEWAVLKLSAVKAGVFNAAENKLLPEDESPSLEFEVHAGDLLVTRANTPDLVGDVAVVPDESHRLLLPDLIYRVGLMPHISSEYVAQVALSRRVRSVVESIARGSSQSMVKLRGEDIKVWPIPKADLAQQTKIVEMIAKGTAESSRLRIVIQRQLELFAERRQALITAAVTGQFDVTTASGRNTIQGV